MLIRVRVEENKPNRSSEPQHLKHLVLVADYSVLLMLYSMLYRVNAVLNYVMLYDVVMFCYVTYHINLFAVFNPIFVVI